MRLRHGKVNVARKTRGEWDAPPWKSREREARNSGTDSGAGPRKFECGPGQPPGPHWSCVPALPCHRGCGAMTASVCSHSQRVRLLPKPAADSVTQWQRFGNCCGGQRPSFASMSKLGGGGRNARATSRVHRFWMFSPRQSALADYRLPPALPQLSGKLRNSHVSLPLTLNQFVAPGNIKRPRCCEEAVEDNTCLWKVEEN